MGYQETTSSGLYYAASSNPTTKPTKKLRIKLAFKKYFTFNYLILETDDLFHAMHFPFSVPIISSVLMPKAIETSFKFGEVVHAIEQVTQISQFMYDRLGFLCNITSASRKGVGNKEIETCLLKYFVPSIFAFVAEKGITALKSLLPFVGPMITTILQLPYFRTPFKGLQSYLSQNDILFSMPAPKDYDSLSFGEKIDTQLLQIVYSQLHPEANDEFSIFFSALWNEITTVFNDDAFLIQKFYTLKFIDVLEGMATNNNICDVDHFFDAFKKLEANLPLKKFVRIVLPLEKVKTTCKLICQLMLNSDIASRSEIFQYESLLFVRELALFLVFFLKYCFYIEFRKLIIYLSKAENFHESIQTLKPIFEDLELLLEVAKKLEPMDTTVNALLSTMNFDTKFECAFFQFDDFDVSLAPEPEVSANSYQELNNEIQSLAKVFSRVELLRHHHELWRACHLHEFDFMSHKYNYVSSKADELAYNLIQNVSFIDEMMQLLDKPVSQWRVEEQEYFNCNSSAFNFFVSLIYFEEFNNKLDVAQKGEFYEYLVSYWVNVQRIKYRIHLNVAQQSKSKE